LPKKRHLIIGEPQPKGPEFQVGEHPRQPSGATASGTPVLGGGFYGLVASAFGGAIPADRLERLDFRGLDFSGLEVSGLLSGMDLRGSSFRRANLAKATLKDCDLRDCDFTEAQFSTRYQEGTRIEGCDLRGANFTKASGGLLVWRCDLRRACFVDAHLSTQPEGQTERGCYSSAFNESDLRGAVMDGMVFGASVFYQCDLRGASLQWVSFNQVDAQRLDVRNANLTRFQILEHRIVNGEPENLRWQYWAGAQFDGANLDLVGDHEFSFLKRAEGAEEAWRRAEP
jgi:uncharacterized protein YjbI with pentapeptide repeats